MHFDGPAYFHLTVKPLTTHDLLPTLTLLNEKSSDILITW